MHYNSIDHFLTVQYDTLLTIMEAAQREAGGHYAAYTAEELHRNAAGDLREVLASVRDLKVDNPALHASARQNMVRGLDLDDLIRMGQAFERGFEVLVEKELQEQWELAAELNRRVRHLGTRFRSNITGVKLDQTIQRLTEQ